MTLRKTGVIGNARVQDGRHNFYVKVVIAGDGIGDDPALEKLAKATGGEFYKDQHKVTIPVTGTSNNPEGLDADDDEVKAAIESLGKLSAVKEFQIQW